MVNLGERIRRVRKLKRISQLELENKIGIKREYLSKIENAELKNPTYNTLLKICRGLGVPLAELVSTEGEPLLRKAPPLNIITDPDAAHKMTKNALVTVPIISQLTAIRGAGHIDVEEIEQYIVMPIEYVASSADTSRFRCLRLAEDDYSMSPVMEPETIVGIDVYQTDPGQLDGKLILLDLNNDECAVRRLKLQKNTMVALPQNLNEYDPLVLALSNKRRILGQVVWCLSKF